MNTGLNRFFYFTRYENYSIGNTKRVKGLNKKVERIDHYIFSRAQYYVQYREPFFLNDMYLLMEQQRMSCDSIYIQPRINIYANWEIFSSTYLKSEQFYSPFLV